MVNERHFGGGCWRPFLSGAAAPAKTVACFATVPTSAMANSADLPQRLPLRAGFRWRLDGLGVVYVHEHADAARQPRLAQPVQYAEIMAYIFKRNG
jgi:hypothetical protein